MFCNVVNPADDGPSNDLVDHDLLQISLAPGIDKGAGCSSAHFVLSPSESRSYHTGTHRSPPIGGAGERSERVRQADGPLEIRRLGEEIL